MINWKQWIGPTVGFSVIAFVSVFTVMGVAAQQNPPVASCFERESTYQNGILVYQCEVMERNGEYFIVESNQSGLISERHATGVEVAQYLGIREERDCLLRQRSAITLLATPARDSTLQAVAERVSLIEDAIRICIQ